ncbi:DUF2732 family protein [Proteus mirabilis]|uniref:DUF2732 domain-containing protein n=4 Tax=Morganellaceae TaxID=1903414 RepID=A0AAJ4RI39_PROMI|nr:DUF2732 domain-containing protein [Proteus mirabilis]NBM38353.1 DUF2732 family protein [Proteus sp. G4419]NBN33375.1 DUF2732 family protein [Proteus sp. G4412]NBN39145.1 DUF2732 family protein [Proteus sp. G2638]NBN56350.1 DUF2732 family protein [Proteus sp. G3927]
MTFICQDFLYLIIRGLIMSKESDVTDLINAVREDERKSRAVFYAVRLHSLISKITSEQMERPEIVQLVEGEIENIEHQAQEWNYV